jgi:hypothetical protein
VLTKRNLLLLLLAAGIGAAAVFGAEHAGSGNGRPFDPKPASEPVVHARAVVDGSEWVVTTYRDKEGHLCAFQGSAAAGRGGTCLDPGSLFARGPVVLYYGSGQDSLGVWDRAWLWGFVADRVERLELTLTTCVVVPLHADADGVFQHVFPAAQLHQGILPAKFVARDATGSAIFSEPIRLGADVPVVRTGAC